MQKQLGSIMLIAGTCIGSGMIALPIAFAEIGILPCLGLMILIWLLIYFTSLVSVELNLQAGKGETLGNLGKKFSGKTAEIIGTSSFKILSYALMAVYIYAGSSVVQKMIQYSYGASCDFILIAICYSLLSMLMLTLPIKFLDYINRFLFIGLIFVIGLLVIGLFSMIEWSNMPLIVDNKSISISIRQILPVLFTAFGFQVIFHILTNYCNKDKVMLKKAFFWGSIIPAIIYMIWTSSILAVIYDKNPLFYEKMSNSPIEVGDLIEELSVISKWTFVKMLVWWISLLTIITSVVGVGAGLKESLQEIVEKNFSLKCKTNLLSAFLAIFPGFIVAALVPNAFIKVLGFAGMILVIIAILLPIYLLTKIDFKKLNYKILKSKALLTISVLAGLFIIFCEVWNLFN